jgi:hypothetical protein
MVGLVATFLPAFLTDDIVGLLTFITSLLITVSMGLLVMKKQKISWLKDFILAFALIGGMASSILWTSWIG